jgi:hypothetical protein
MGFKGWDKIADLIRFASRTRAAAKGLVARADAAIKRLSRLP